jgi:quinol monooxygenase YgiN
VSENSEQPPLELTVVTLVFDAREADEASADRLMAVLSKYVVVSRNHPGCRNIDLCASVISPGRYLIIEKWESPEAQQAHFDSVDMVEMARACEGLLAHAPDIDLYEGISAHDLW